MTAQDPHLATPGGTAAGQDATEPRVAAELDGEVIEAPRGASVAAAIMSTGRVSWRTTRGGRARGLFCGIGVCFDCIVEIDGESGQRACMVPLTDGMRICTAPGGASEPADENDSRSDGEAGA